MTAIIFISSEKVNISVKYEYEGMILRRWYLLYQYKNGNIPAKMGGLVSLWRTVSELWGMKVEYSHFGLFSP